MAAIDFNVVVAANGGPIQGGINGIPAGVDLVKPVNYVEPGNKLVRVDQGRISLEASLAHAVLAAQGFPQAATPVTAEHMRAAMRRIGATWAVHSLVELAAGAGWQPVFRESDMLSEADAAAMPNYDACRDFVRNLKEYLDQPQNTAKKAGVMCDSLFVVLAAEFQGIHREQNEGHSCYTDRLNDRTSLTARAAAIAEGKKDKFKTFLATDNFGHDLWHFLSDKSLNQLVELMTGKMDNPPAIGVALEYAGQPCRNRCVHEVLGLGEGAKDRWPVTELGKAALIVGLELTASNMTDITGRVNVPGADRVIVGIRRLKDHISGNNLGRASILTLKSALSYTVAHAFGYYYADPIRVMDKEDYPALANFAKRCPAASGDGANMRRLVHDLEVDPAAVGTLITTLANTLADGVNTANAGMGVNAGVIRPVEQVVIRPSAEERMMASMARMPAIAPGGAQGPAPALAAPPGPALLALPAPAPPAAPAPAAALAAAPVVPAAAAPGNAAAPAPGPALVLPQPGQGNQNQVQQPAQPAPNP